MAKKIYFEGNYFLVVDPITLQVLAQDFAVDVYIGQSIEGGDSYSIGGKRFNSFNIAFADIRTKSNVAYSSQEDWEAFYQENTGQDSISEDYFLEAKRGNISGVTSFSILGLNDDIDTNSTPEDVWDGGGVYQGFNKTAGSQLSFVSNDLGDDCTIVVEILKLDYTRVIEEVIINGTTPVLSVATDALRVNGMFVKLPSTGDKSNIGVLTCSHTSDVMSQINPGQGITHQTCCTVPLGKTWRFLKLVSWLNDLQTNSAKINVVVSPFGRAEQRLITFSVSKDGGQSDIESKTFFTFPEKTDIRFEVPQVFSNDSSITVALQILEEDS